MDQTHERGVSFGGGQSEENYQFFEALQASPTAAQISQQRKSHSRGRFSHHLQQTISSSLKGIRPLINDNREIDYQIKRSPSQSLQLSTRLYKDALRKSVDLTLRQNHQLMQEENDLKQICTFKPSLCEGSIELLKTIRNEKRLMPLQEQGRKYYKDHYEPPKFPFKPQINKQTIPDVQSQRTIAEQKGSQCFLKRQLNGMIIRNEQENKLKNMGRPKRERRTGIPHLQKVSYREAVQILGKELRETQFYL
ncbi:hypothetical protein FGO68_gene9994 [Halteria grandinella]|uniref:Uncharacterized protein n=1 Tax=Halteria grandinella TaxID=5974 RepID=A0A8J8NJW5_HALGN|nr:hypothetical protein FGO68_gene9994 [Halteria grandinella]